MMKEYKGNGGAAFLAEEILPCPFCGGTAEIIFKGNDYTKKRAVTIKCSDRYCRVERTDAGLRASHEEVAKWCIEAWNKRVKL